MLLQIRLAGTLVLATTPLAAQRPLPPATIEFTEPLTTLAGVVELGGDRIAVLDREEQRVVVADVRTGTVRPVARIGDGPREYRMPWTLMDLAGDSAAIYDAANRRLLVIRPDGTPGDFLGIPGTSSTVHLPMGPNGPAAIDHAGRFYWTGNRFDLRPGVRPNSLADSVPILRQAAGARRPDTLGHLRRPNLGARGELDAADAERHARLAWPMRDDWTVLPNGTVVVVRAPEHRLEVLEQSNRGRMIALPAAALPLTSWLRSRWEARRCGERTLAYRVRSDGSLSRPTLTGGSAQTCGPHTWPEIVPGFLAGETVADPRGAVWIRRTPRTVRDASTYDIVPVTPQATRQVVTLPSGVRVVAVGARRIYAVRTDDDGLQYLQVIPR